MEQFFEKIKNDPALKAKYEAILKKHEAAKDRDAAAAELSEFACSEGFDATPDGILSAFAPKGEIGEEELEAVSGGGAGILCAFCINIVKLRHGPVLSLPGEPDKYHRLCAHNGDILCTWIGCMCHSTRDCVNGYHRCAENGQYVPGHL